MQRSIKGDYAVRRDMEGSAISEEIEWNRERDARKKTRSVERAMFSKEKITCKLT